MKRSEFPPSQHTSPSEKSMHQVERISIVEEEAFALLMPKHQELAIKLEDFADTYGPEEIERDRQAVERKKARTERTDSASHRRAKLLEALLTDQIEMSEWFGRGVMTIVPSEYDDEFNGIDLTVEFEKEGYFQYLAMGIDVKSGPGPIEDKLNKIRKHIEDGSLTEMKYLISERGNIKGRHSNIPQFVVGADLRTTRELAQLWLTTQRPRLAREHVTKSEMEELRQSAKEAQDKLAKHRARALILNQLHDQLETFIQFAQSQKLTEVEVRFRNLIPIIETALKSTSLSKSQEQENDLDDVNQAIKEKLKTFTG